jgi:sulfate transport system ATP-binding protein
MTVFENIAFGLRVQPKESRPSEETIKDRVQKLLSLVQLDGMAVRFPNQLSGGQRQRVALARALAIEPKVLLLDEPFGALDARVRKQLRAWLRRLHDELHVTSVFVTHDQDEALEVADRVVIMNEGRVEQVGTPEEVFQDPATEFVMTFLGDVNQFQGPVQNGRVEIGGIQLPVPVEIKTENARVFVRPHELEVRSSGSTGPGFAAKLIRVQPAGPRVRLELEDEPSGQTFFAELGDDEWREMQGSVGDSVRVRPRRVRVFPAKGRSIKESLYD